MSPTSRSWLVAALKQVAPFALTAIAAWVTAPIGSTMNWKQYATSVMLLLASWSFGLIMAYRGHMRAGTVLGSLGFLMAVGFLRNSAGGSISGVSSVALLAVFQTALYVRDRRALWIVLAGLAAFYLIPLVTVGPPEYPANGYRSALLAVAVGSIVGLVTHGLVANIRRRARDAHRREQMLVRVNETVQELFGSANPRQNACGAVKAISDATVAGLFEPEPGSHELRLTTITTEPDADAATLQGRAAADSAVHQAFRSRKPVLITEDPAAHVGDVTRWRAAGAPATVLYQPLLNGDDALGVMFAGWQDIAQRDEPRVIVASLLAHEIAMVIDRTDMIEQLTDEARTDPLTGLHNRRAWDARLERALGGADTVAVAMLDIDHFKRFNDTHGHPAGDQFLREVASSWRTLVRAGDFLARLGGEEFALLLTGDDAQTVCTTVERIRAQMPAGQTCSAGIARRIDGDTPEDLIGRADAALYEAKAGGRNRTVFTDESLPRAAGA